jgi:hypothetical protein
MHRREDKMHEWERRIAIEHTSASRSNGSRPQLQPFPRGFEIAEGYKRPACSHHSLVALSLLLFSLTWLDTM